MPRFRVLVGLAAALLFAVPVVASASITVTALPAFSGAANGVVLNWTDNGSNVDYDIWRHASTSGSSCSTTPIVTDQLATVNGATTYSDTPPTEGAWCYLVAGVTDATLSISVVTTYDGTAPATPTLMSPPAGTALRGSVAFTATSVSDALAGVARTEIAVSLNGLIVPVWTTEATQLVPPFTTITVDTSDPFYDATVWDAEFVTTDGAGNTAASAPVLALTYDNTPPDVLPTFTTAPADNAVTGGTISFASSTPVDTGGSGIARVAVERATHLATTWTEVSSDSTDPYTSLDWASSGTGHLDFRLVAYDLAGNSVATGVLVSNVLVDNTPPTAPVRVQGPTDGTNVGGTVTVQASATDADSGLARVALRVDGLQVISDITTAAAWNSMGSTDGAHTLVLRAYDVVGNTQDTTIGSVTVDNTGPNAPVFVTRPANGSVQRGMVAFSSTTPTDATTSVGHIDLEKSSTGGPPWTLVSAVNTPGPYTWDTTVGADGTYSLRLRAYDVVGNVSAASPPVTGLIIDNTAPTLPAPTTAPATGSAQPSRTVTVSGSVSDALSGVASVALQERVGAAAYATVATDSSGGATYTTSWTAPSDLTVDLQVVATDVAGNTSTTAVATGVTLDTTAPTAVTWNPGPAANAVVHGSQSIRGSASDPHLARVAFRVDGVEVIADVQLLSSWDTASVLDGPHTISLRAYDTAGNQTTSSRPITVDNTPPTAPVVTSPTAGTFVTGTVSVTATSTDATSGVARIALYVDGSATATTPAIGAGYSWSSTAVVDGAHTLTLRAVDNGGLTNDTVVNVTVDNTAPSTPTVLQGPVAGAQVRQSVPVHASSSDAGAGVARVALLVDGAQGLADVTSGASWDTTAFSDGAHTLVLRAYDNVGLTTDLTIGSLTVDNTAPTVPLFDPTVSPADGSAVRGAVPVLGSSFDTNLARIAFLVAGSQRIVDVRTTQSWDTTVEATGPHTISLTAYDLAGNSSTTSRTVTVDNVPPILSVATHPVDGSAQATTTVTVTGASSDLTSGLASVVLQARVGTNAYATVATDSTGGATYSLTSSSLADGAWDLRVVSTDAAGNTTTVAAGAGVIVDTVAPTLPTFAVGPMNGDAVRGIVQIRGASTDTNLVRVAFLVDGLQVIADVRTQAGWDTAAVSFPDGPHTIALKAYDVADNASTVASLSVTVDNIAPTAPVVTTTPTITAGVRYGDTIVINASSSDVTTSVTRIELRNGATVLTADIGAGYSWDTTLGPDGTHTLTARAYDLAGNTADTTLTVIVDNLPPAAPTGLGVAALVRTNPAVTWDALVGTNDVSEWHVYVDGSASFATVPAPSFTPSLALDGSADGAHTFVVRAYDGIHESPDSTTVTTTIDTVAPTTPTFQPGSPVDGASVAGTVPVLGQATDPHLTRVALLVDGVEKLADVSAPSVWDTTTAGDGSHVIALVAYDGAGNVSTPASRTVTVDNTAPALTVSTAPADGSAQPSGIVDVTGTVTDTGGTGVASVSLEARTGANAFAQMATAGATSPYDLSATLADGVWDLRVVAVDAVGNTTIVGASTGVLIDTVAPTTPTFGTEPVDGSNVHGAVAVQGASSDTNLVRVALLVDGVQRIADVSSGASWNTAGESDGVHALLLVAHDVVAHAVTSVPRSVTVDNTGPTTPLVTTTPTIQAGHRYGDTIVVHASATDATTSVARIELREGTTVLVADIGSGFSWDTTSGVADGSHTLTARAFDVLGNSTDATITIVVDNTAPPAPVVSGGASPTKAQPTLSWPAPAGGSDVVEWHVYRDGSLTPVTVTTPSFTDSLGASSDGDHSYVVRAFDGVHESAASTPVVITYDTTPPAAPSAATGTARADGSGVDLSWTAVPADLDHYLVRRAIGATAPASVTDGVAVCGGSLVTVTCADTAITEKTTYRYSVFAVDVAGNASAPGSTAAVVTPDITAPGAPAALTARVAGAKVVLGWPASTSPDVTGYRLVVSGSHAPTGPTDGTLLAAGTARTLTRQQAAGSTAYYAVFAQDAVGNTSGAAVVTVAIPKLGRVAPLAGTEVRGAVHLSWTAVKRATYYNVQVYIGKKLVAQAWPTGTRWTLPTKGLKAGKRYTWYVWPGIGARRPARYGKLIGSSTFVWLGR